MKTIGDGRAAWRRAGATVVFLLCLAPYTAAGQKETQALIVNERRAHVIIDGNYMKKKQALSPGRHTVRVTREYEELSEPYQTAPWEIVQHKIALHRLACEMEFVAEPDKVYAVTELLDKDKRFFWAELYELQDRRDVAFGASLKMVAKRIERPQQQVGICQDYF